MPPGTSRFVWSSARSHGCTELWRHASDYLESDISEEEKEHIRRHLEKCGNCTRLMETLRATIEMLGDLPRGVIPQSLKDRLLQLPTNQGQGQT